MNILLIAGHGAGDSGAVATIDGKVYKEADLTREAVSILKRSLEEYGVCVGVYATSRNAYTDYTNGNLVNNANFKKYDYVLEIHFNAGGSDLKGDGKVKGDEIYWPSRSKQTGLEVPITSRMFTGYAQRQSKSGKFAVINTAAGYGVKANLLEVCFIDDADDMRLYVKRKYAIIQAIADGVAEKYKLTNKKEDDEMPRWKTINDVPEGYREKVEDYVKRGIIKGKGDGILDITEDMLRVTIYDERMIKEMLKGK